MPEYIQICEKFPGNVETLAQTMLEREKDLIRAFNGSDNLKKSFNDRKHLTELKKFSAQAWMMYFNLKNLKDFIGELVKNQNTYNKADKGNPSHIANLYGLHVQTGYYIDANIKDFFNVYKKGLFSKKCPNTLPNILSLVILESIDNIVSISFYIIVNILLLVNFLR